MRVYDEEGWVKPVHDYAQGALATPERLTWDVPEPLEQHVTRALQFNVKVCVCACVCVCLRTRVLCVCVCVRSPLIASEQLQFSVKVRMFVYTCIVHSCQSDCGST